MSGKAGEVTRLLDQSLAALAALREVEWLADVLTEMLGVDELRALIVEAGRDPVERDTLYRPVRREGADWRVESSVT